MNMEKKILMCGMIVILMLVGFGSSISNSDYKKFIMEEFDRYLQDKATLLNISELRTGINYYTNVSGGDINLSESGLSQAAQFIVNASDDIINSSEFRYYALSNGERLVCEGNTNAHSWYKQSGRCGEQSGLDYWNSQPSATYDTFNKYYDDYCYKKIGMGGDACNDRLLCRPGDDYETNSEWCISKNGMSNVTNDMSNVTNDINSNNQTNITVILMYNKNCDDNDVYWFDSNGVKGAKAEECGSLNTYNLKDVCYKGNCGTCRYDIGVTCSTDKDGYKIDSNCINRPRYAWMELNGGGLYGSGGTWGYNANLHAASDPKFVTGTTEYISNGYMVWRGELIDNGWYRVCESDMIVQ